MAVFYSDQYDKLYVPPLTRTQACEVYGVTYKLWFNFPNPASGGASGLGDVVYLVKVPPVCQILMIDSFFRFSAWDTNTTIDIGWLAYTGANEAAVAADDNGLLDGMDVDAAGSWYGGVNRTGTTTLVRHEPVVDIYTVRASGLVTLTATFRTTAPTASDFVRGYFTVLVD